MMDIGQVAEVTLKSNGDRAWEWSVRLENGQIRRFHTDGAGNIYEVYDEQAVPIHKGSDEWQILWHATRWVPGDYGDSKNGSRWNLKMQRGHPINVQGGAVW